MRRNPDVPDLARQRGVRDMARCEVECLVIDPFFHDGGDFQTRNLDLPYQ